MCLLQPEVISVLSAQATLFPPKGLCCANGCTLVLAAMLVESMSTPARMTPTMSAAYLINYHGQRRSLANADAPRQTRRRRVANHKRAEDGTCRYRVNGMPAQSTVRVFVSCRAHSSREPQPASTCWTRLRPHDQSSLHHNDCNDYPGPLAYTLLFRFLIFDIAATCRRYSTPPGCLRSQCACLLILRSRDLLDSPRHIRRSLRGL